MSEQKQRKLIVTGLDGCEPEIGRLLWAVEDARLRTLNELANLGDNVLDRRTMTSSNTIGTILYHIAAIEASWLYDEALRQPMPDDVAALFPADVRDEQQALAALQGQTLNSYLHRLAVVRSKLLEAYKAMSPAEFRTVYSFVGQYDTTPEWILYHLMQHEGEHRGQLQMMVESFAKRGV